MDRGVASFRRWAIGSACAATLGITASCQLVAGIEPWGAGGADATSTGTQDPITGSSATGCACSASVCFGGECSCDAGDSVVCKPRDVSLTFQSKCAAGGRRCIAAAPDHVMVIEKDGDNDKDLVVLVSKAVPADGGPVLVAQGLADVAWSNGKGYALADVGVYSGDTKSWPATAPLLFEVPAVPAFLRRLRFGNTERLAYVDDSRSSTAGLWLLDGDTALKKLPSVYVGADTDGTRGFAVIASSPTLVNVFDATITTTEDLEVPGALPLDLTAGDDHLFVLTVDGVVTAKDTSADGEFAVVPLPEELVSKKIQWTPRYVYATDLLSKLYRFANKPPYTLDPTFLIEAPGIKDFAVDAQGVYWVDGGKQLHLLATKND